MSTYGVMQTSSEALNPVVSRWDGICWSKSENSLDGIAWLPSNQSPDEFGELGNEQALWQKREKMRSFTKANYVYSSICFSFCLDVHSIWTEANCTFG